MNKILGRVSSLMDNEYVYQDVYQYMIAHFLKKKLPITLSLILSPCFRNHELAKFHSCSMAQGY